MKKSKQNKEEEEKLLQIKEQIVDNLETIQSAIDDCVYNGMADDHSELYNLAIDLIDDTHAINLLPELELVVMRAQNLEKSVDVWLSNHGMSSMQLSWPFF